MIFYYLKKRIVICKKKIKHTKEIRNMGLGCQQIGKIRGIMDKVQKENELTKQKQKKRLTKEERE